MSDKPNQTQEKTLKIPQSKFLELYNTDYNQFIEHIPSGSRVLSYISWAHCVRLMKEHFENLSVDFELTSDGSVAHCISYNDKTYCEVRPFLTDGNTRTPCLHFPVMNPRQRHSAALNPDSRQISDACLRGFVKCVAVYTGIGLSLYAGEDLPDSGIEVTSASVDAEKVVPIKDFEKEKKQQVERAKENIRQSVPESSEVDGERIILNCSFSEKEEVKSLGARWNKELKKWCISKKYDDVTKFTKWIDGEVTEEEPAQQVEPVTQEEEDEDVPF